MLKNTKKPVLFLSILPVITLVFLFSSCDHSQDKDITALQELNKNITQLPSVSPLQYKDEVFRKFNSYFENAQVIGLGEDSHGVKEFFELKQRIFKYLVENHNCRALGFEYGFRFQRSLEIENYITSRKGDLDSILSGLYWIHRNKEFRGLIEWMREYNSSLQKEDMIHFIGIDSQIDIWYLDELSQHFFQYDKNLYEFVSEILDALSKWGKIDHQKLKQEEFQQIENLLISLKDKTLVFFSNHSNSGEDKMERDLLLHNIESHILSHENRYWMYKNKSLRDSHMAKHVLWLKEIVGNEAKVAVWAHNAHVANDPHYARDGSPAMGRYLREKLGDKYLVIGTGFTEGQFVAVTEDYFGEDTNPIIWKLNIFPPKNSVNYLFCQADYKNFILDIKGLSRTGNLYTYINKERPFFGVGDFYSATYPETHFAEDRIINLATAYDMIFYFSDTRPITLIKKEP